MKVLTQISFVFFSTRSGWEFCLPEAFPSVDPIITSVLTVRRALHTVCSGAPCLRSPCLAIQDIKALSCPLGAGSWELGAGSPFLPNSVSLTVQNEFMPGSYLHFRSYVKTIDKIYKELHGTTER